MSLSPRTRKKPMSEINVVPYIDVMLVLLVIFMVTAPMLTQGVNVELPETSSEPLPQSDREPLIVSVDTNGAYYLEVGDERGKPMALSDLTSQVGKILQQAPGTEVYVRGDQQVRYGVVMNLMASLQQAGAASVGLITEPPRE
ncbi:MAG: protein TolR [Oleiphilaceae bacterium]|nr:protein TolR [Oleiphilaceae bacterium]